MNNCLAPLLAIILSSCAVRQTYELASTHPDPDRVRQAMRDVIVPDVDLQAVAALDAIRFVTESFREHHPNHFGLSFVYQVHRGPVTVQPVWPLST